MYPRHTWRLEDNFREWTVSCSWVDMSERDVELRQAGLHLHLSSHLGCHISALFKSQKMRFDSGLSSIFFWGFSG